jgi:2-oxoglutarate ferredoxin oxidoreductase subunit alpha
LNPFPENLKKVLGNFSTILVPELNLGQLAAILRAQFLVNAQPIAKVQGQPFKIQEIIDGIKCHLKEGKSASWQQQKTVLLPS